MNDKTWSTPDGQRADRPIHCYPLDDIREHVIDGSPCPCMPSKVSPSPVIEEDGSASMPDDSHSVIRHNSYDGREVGEVCRRALFRMGVALSDHDHTWSSDERDAFEHAIDVLEMHWPEPDGHRPRPEWWDRP